MEKRDPAGPEADLPVPVRRTVFSVAYKGKAAGRELRPDLMGPPGHQTYKDEASFPDFGNRFIAQTGRACIGPGFSSRKGLVNRVVPIEQVLHLPLVGKSAVTEDKIFLLEYSGANLRGQVGGGTGRPGEQNKAAYHLIQAVYRAKVCSGVSKLRTDQLRQAARLIRGQNAGRLYAGKDAVVLIENLHPYVPSYAAIAPSLLYHARQDIQLDSEAKSR